MDKFSIFSSTCVIKCQSKPHSAFIQKGKLNRIGKTIVRREIKDSCCPSLRLNMKLQYQDKIELIK